MRDLLYFRLSSLPNLKYHLIRTPVPIQPLPELMLCFASFVCVHAKFNIQGHQSYNYGDGRRQVLILEAV